MSATMLAPRRMAPRRGRRRLVDLMSLAGVAAPSMPRSAGVFGGRAGGACSVATDRLMIRPAGVLLGHSPKCGEAGLAPAGDPEETGLPPVPDPRLVPEQEPDHHVDARVAPGNREGQSQVARLLRERDAEEPVRRLRLVAVLRDPEPLVPVQASELPDQLVDVPERDRAGARWRLVGRLVRMPVVRMVRIGVEAGAGALQATQKDERRDRRAGLGTGVVPAGGGHSAGDLLARQARQVDTRPDRVAHLGIDARAPEPEVP